MKDLQTAVQTFDAQQGWTGTSGTAASLLVEQIVAVAVSLVGLVSLGIVVLSSVIANARAAGPSPGRMNRRGGALHRIIDRGELR